MNNFCLVLILAASCSFAGALAGLTNATAEWEAYKLNHGKVYESRIEDSLRRKLFLAAKQRIDKFNDEESAKAGYRKGLNHMSDWTEAEIEQILRVKFDTRNNLLPKNTRKGEEHLARILSAARSRPLPDEVDWRKVEGRVSPVTDQGHCGSCWAFSAVGLLEGQELKVTGRKELIPLSVQNLVDCGDEDGCAGSYPTRALLTIFLQKGINDALSYPYTAKYNPICAWNASNVVMTDHGPITVPKDEEVLKAVVAEYGPVSVVIFADQAFIEYKSGVFNSKWCKGTWLSHAMLVVGYGTDPNQGDYWIVVSRAVSRSILVPVLVHTLSLTSFEFIPMPPSTIIELYRKTPCRLIGAKKDT